jgi:hypothetical protein
MLAMAEQRISDEELAALAETPEVLLPAARDVVADLVADLIACRGERDTLAGIVDQARAILAEHEPAVTYAQEAVANPDFVMVMRADRALVALADLFTERETGT